MMDHTKAVAYEIGGVFDVAVREDGLHVEKLEMLKQESESNGLHLDTDAEELLVWQTQRGWSGETVFANWGQWHSHVTAGVGRSAEDEGNIRAMVTHGYYVTLIVNQQEQVHCSVDALVGHPDPTKAEHVTWDGVMKVKTLELPQEEQARLKKERDEKVTTITPAERHGWWEPRASGKGKRKKGGKGHHQPHPGYHHYGWGWEDMVGVDVEDDWWGKEEPGKATALKCETCERTYGVCTCKGAREMYEVGTEKLKWPVVGKFPAKMKKNGYTVKFHRNGVVSLQFVKDKQRFEVLHVQPTGMFRAFLEGCGFSRKLFQQHYKSGDLVQMMAGAQMYAVDRPGNVTVQMKYA